MELTRSPDQWVRLHTVSLFENMRVEAVAVLPRITQLLNDPNTQVVWTAIDCLGNIGPDASVAIPQLMVFMKTTTGTDYSRVRHSATALGKIGPLAKGALPYIISHMKNEGGYADDFISAVGHFGPLARDAIPYLTRRLDDAQWTYSVNSAPEQAAWALGEMGKHAQPAMPTLLRIVEITNGDDDHFLLRRAILDAIVKIDPTSDTFITLLIEATTREQVGTKTTAVDTLGDIMVLHPALLIRHAEIVNALRIVLRHDRNSYVRSHASRALAKIGPSAKAAIPELRVLLKNQFNESDAHGAARALGSMGEHSSEAVADLVANIQPWVDKGPRSAGRWRQLIVTTGAIIAIGQIGPKADEAVGVLMSVLDKPDDDERWASYKHHAATALGRIGPRAQVATILLREQLKSSQPIVRANSAIALSRIDAGYQLDHEAVTDDFIEFFYAEVGRIVDDELGYIAEMGTRARRAIPVIRKISRFNSYDYTRAAAEGAIQRILGDSCSSQ